MRNKTCDGEGLWCADVVLAWWSRKLFFLRFGLPVKEPPNKCSVKYLASGDCRVGLGCGQIEDPGVLEASADLAGLIRS